MPTDAFADRERGFEAKFQLDMDQQFRAVARRNRLFGLWVAGELGRTGADAEAYAREVVAADMAKPGDDDLLDKVETDLRAAGKPADRKHLQAELSRFLPIAAQQVVTEKRG